MVAGSNPAGATSPFRLPMINDSIKSPPLVAEEVDQVVELLDHPVSRLDHIMQYTTTWKSANHGKCTPDQIEHLREFVREGIRDIDVLDNVECIGYLRATFRIRQFCRDEWDELFELAKKKLGRSKWKTMLRGLY